MADDDDSSWNEGGDEDLDDDDSDSDGKDFEWQPGSEQQNEI